MLDQIGAQAAVPLDAYGELSADGMVTILVSRDEMTAQATFHPPTGSGQPFSLETVREAIALRGIVYGVDWDAVKGCILTCNEERVEVADAVLARGKKPVDERPPFLVLADRLVVREKRDGAEGPRVDFKELSLFTLVKKEDVLATLEPKQDGVMGINVRGNAVAFGKERASFPRPGKNTVMKGGTVVATCDGRFQVNADSFWVDEVLDILGDIDLRVGNIDFPGTW